MLGVRRGDAFGSGAANGRDRAGPTATLLSAARMDPTGALCGTSILNLSLDESLVRDDGTFEKLVTLVEAYFREGGLHLQLNRVSREELLDAKAHPERHGSLRVRVSGFSAFFTTLSGTIQDDVIARTVHFRRLDGRGRSTTCTTTRSTSSPIPPTRL